MIKLNFYIKYIEGVVIALVTEYQDDRINGRALMRVQSIML